MSGDWEQMLVVGRVGRPHGLRGQVVVNPDTHFAEERFVPGARLYLEQPGGPRVLEVEHARFWRGRPIVAFRGVETIEDAEALGRGELRMTLEALGPPPEGAFYHHELVGCDVVDEEGGTIGTVVKVDDTTGTSVLVVQGRGREMLIPFATEICVTIDVAARRIVVAPPPGLLELNG